MAMLTRWYKGSHRNPPYLTPTVIRAGMLRELFEDGGEYSPAECRSIYDERLAETIEAVGIDTVVEKADIGRPTIESILDGESPELTLDEAARILATDPTLPDAEAIAAESRDILLLGMSIAVLDVEAVASGINDELEPKEIQAKAEGRHPMSLDEYALLHSFIERRKR